jgi:hypothetical protein
LEAAAELTRGILAVEDDDNIPLIQLTFAGTSA